MLATGLLLVSVSADPGVGPALISEGDWVSRRSGQS